MGNDGKKIQDDCVISIWIGGRDFYKIGKMNELFLFVCCWEAVAVIKTFILEVDIFRCPLRNPNGVVRRQLNIQTWNSGLGWRHTFRSHCTS